MILFTKNLEEDLAYMKQGVKSGLLSQARLDEAVTKILALKAALKLYKKKADGSLLSGGQARARIGCADHLKWAKECADRSITLVKQEPGVLPISPLKTRRVLLYAIESNSNVLGFGATGCIANSVQKRLESEGFTVELFVPPQGFEGMMASEKDFVGRHDLIIYIANLATRSNQTTVRIEWENPMGANVPIYIASIPTIFISLQNPYHLVDVPRVRTYINTYGANGVILEALIDKLTGRSPFIGKSPVDPFCGLWDAKL
jgi:beta-N-acetylhexosaminidase